jgi:hypothetical protein
VEIRNPFSTKGIWLKGNTHIHSTASDGGKTFAELAAMYSQAGYDFLFRTDHWVASDAGAERDKAPLLWIDGIELDGRDHGGSAYHVVCLGKVAGIDRSMGFVAAMEAARAQGGYLILAHPHWMGNTLEDALRWGFHGVELYNHVCRWLNGKGESAVYWNAMLRHAPLVSGFACDDAHIRPEHPGWNGGWICVNAKERSPVAVLDAIRTGDFYSSCGPVIKDLRVKGDKLEVRCTPVQFARLAGPNSEGKRIGSFDGELLTKATLPLPANWAYGYLELEDDHGRRAWTNNLFVPEKKQKC